MNKIVNLMGAGEMQWSCELLSYNLNLRKQTNKKETNKQSNILTLTASCDRRSCLIKSKMKKEKKD